MKSICNYANLKQVLLFKKKLFAEIVSLQAFALCVAGRASIYVRDAGPVWGRPDSVWWAGRFVYTVHPLLCCREYVYLPYYIYITCNSSGVTCFFICNFLVSITYSYKCLKKTLHLKKSPVIYLFKVVLDTSILWHTSIEIW